MELEAFIKQNIEVHRAMAVNSRAEGFNRRAGDLRAQAFEAANWHDGYAKAMETVLQFIREAPASSKESK